MGEIEDLQERIKEIYKICKEEYGIPTKYSRAIASMNHKQNVEQLKAENAAKVTFYDRLYKNNGQKKLKLNTAE